MNPIAHFYWFLKDLFKIKGIIWDLTVRDVRTKFLGSHLGLTWSIIQPLTYLLILWFVFTVGFKTPSVDNVPFFLWLMCGMIPWIFIAECLQSGTNSVIEYNYLVKKVVFRVSTLPLVKILSTLLIHAFFIFMTVFMYLIYGYDLSLYNLQVFYYLAGAIMLTIGLTWITSSVVVFLKDISQIVTVILQFGFWLTPIFWTIKMLPNKYHFWIKLNPVYYVTEGYRDCFLYKSWFWEHPAWTIYFWVVTLTLFFIGAIVFRRLRPHFADVI